MNHGPIVGVAHLGIRVFDLARSRAFYEKLGFEFVMGPVGPEPVAIMRHPSGVEVNFVLNAPAAADRNILQDVPDKHPGFTHVALRVDSMAATLTHLEAVDIAIKDGPIQYPGGSSGVFIRDPDFNTLELYAAAPTASETA